MTPLDNALAAHSALLGAPVGDRDRRYLELLRILSGFDMTPMGTNPEDIPPVSDLVGHPPGIWMIAIIVDLGRHGIMPPPINDTSTVTERLISGLLAKFN